MPIYVNFNLGGRLASANAASAVHGVTLHGQKLKPGNLVAAVNAYRWGVETPRDTGSGGPHGRRPHALISVTKETDSASPLLWQAAATNEAFQIAHLTFSKPTSSGKTATWNTITLTNATITVVRRYSSRIHPHSHNTFELEEIDFAFQKIESTWLAGSVSASDDWNAG